MDGGRSDGSDSGDTSSRVGAETTLLFAVNEITDITDPDYGETVAASSRLTYGFMDGAVTLGDVRNTIDEWADVKYPHMRCILSSVQTLIDAQKRTPTTRRSIAHALWHHLSSDNCTCTANIRRSYLECDVHQTVNHSCQLPYMAAAVDSIHTSSTRVGLPNQVSLGNGLGSIARAHFFPASQT